MIKAKVQNNMPGSEGSIPREGCQCCFAARDRTVWTHAKHSEEKLLDFEPVVWRLWLQTVALSPPLPSPSGHWKLRTGSWWWWRVGTSCSYLFHSLEKLLLNSSEQIPVRTWWYFHPWLFSFTVSLLLLGRGKLFLVILVSGLSKLPWQTIKQGWLLGNSMAVNSFKCI